MARRTPTPVNGLADRDRVPDWPLYDVRSHTTPAGDEEVTLRTAYARIASGGEAHGAVRRIATFSGVVHRTPLEAADDPGRLLRNMQRALLDDAREALTPDTDKTTPSLAVRPTGLRT